MKVYEDLLSERKREIQAHLKLITELNDAAVARLGIANLEQVETEHVEILKSGFLIHLYNVVEAIMDVILTEVAKATVDYPPKQWSMLIIKEWARSRAGVERDLESNKRLLRTTKILKEAISDELHVKFRIVSRGNWSNDEIENISDRVGCRLEFDPNVFARACNTPFQDDLAPMKFVRHKRNQLAHGNETFGVGSKSLSPEDLDRLYNPVVNYMSSVAKSYTNYLDNQLYLQKNIAA
ncbi:MAG: MAE_28990/MAE_18760 family HEPN-like nuclease [Rhodospirillaceae bacterium]|nr:MAE_28990/MAE_18760 family HEPN-like nuclease [Rhodospirillaceae bacterium]